MCGDLDLLFVMDLRYNHTIQCGYSDYIEITIVTPFAVSIYYHRHHFMHLNTCHNKYTVSSRRTVYAYDFSCHGPPSFVVRIQLRAIIITCHSR